MALGKFRAKLAEALQGRSAGVIHVDCDEVRASSNLGFASFRPMLEWESIVNNETWNVQQVDGGLLAFDRKRGLNLLSRNEQTVALRRIAPRSLQIGLLTPCNLSCDFCYRDLAAPSKLTSDFLLDLLTKAADWGVLEVSFGGGEPLLFKGFVPLVRQLHEQTSLGINFTTNGTLLTPEIISELGDAVGEVRVSAYRDNHYRRTLRLLRGRRVGLNLLVTPANLGMIEVIVQDALRQGARNVQLLGYKGSDEGLHLSPNHLKLLKQIVLRLQNLPLRLDICWYPLLTDLPHLFPRTDCLAGDEFLVITPDQAIQPCSFHHERIPFEDFDDLQRIYADLRSRRPVAQIDGCTRQQFVQLNPPAPVSSSGIWLWHARSSNNSADCTIVGRFRSVDLARQAAEALRQLSRAHEAFLANPEGQVWLEEHDYYGSWPTPPLQQFGKAHGFDWSKEGEGLWWEEDGCGAPVLTAGNVGDAVVVYHPYCMGLPEEPFRQYLAAVGATEFSSQQYDRPSVFATAIGDVPDAGRAIKEYLKLIEMAEYPSDVKQPPPWGAECDDPRLLDDEDRSARLASGACKVEVDEGKIRLVLTFENTFAGAIALEQWLLKQGYADVAVHIDHSLESLQISAESTIRPNTELYSKVQSINVRIAKMNHRELIEAIFAYHSNEPEALGQAIADIPLDERLHLARETWRKLRKPSVDVDWRALLVIEQTGSAAADWMREMWPLLLRENYTGMGIALRAMAAVLPTDESYEFARQWLDAAEDRRNYTERLHSFYSLRNPRTIALIEQWWQQSEPNTPVTGDWGRIAAASLVDWPTLRRWLEGGRPLALIALAALQEYAEKGPPTQYNKPERWEFEIVLNGYKAKDAVPRVSKNVDSALATIDKLTIS
jgi:MoaA/NifB/PqqE/SkfB family radical SAM enzyme